MSFTKEHLPGSVGYVPRLNHCSWSEGELLEINSGMDTRIVIQDIRR